MTANSADNFIWLDPWYGIEDTANLFVRELEREAIPGHILYGAKLKAIARRYDCDDVLFQFINEPEKFACVHLTYAKETTPHWPDAKIYNSWQEWLKYMQDDFNFFHSNSNDK